LATTTTTSPHHLQTPTKLPLTLAATTTASPPRLITSIVTKPPATKNQNKKPQNKDNKNGKTKQLAGNKSGQTDSEPKTEHKR
jgi:hypothetical protein